MFADKKRRTLILGVRVRLEPRIDIYYSFPSTWKWRYASAVKIFRFIVKKGIYCSFAHSKISFFHCPDLERFFLVKLSNVKPWGESIFMGIPRVTNSKIRWNFTVNPFQIFFNQLDRSLLEISVGRFSGELFSRLTILTQSRCIFTAHSSNAKRIFFTASDYRRINEKILFQPSLGYRVTVCINTLLEATTPTRRA